MVLKVIILVWSLIPFGSAFQVLGADALNDLSPNATLYRQVGSSRISPLDADRRENLLFPLIPSTNMFDGSFRNNLSFSEKVGGNSVEKKIGD